MTINMNTQESLQSMVDRQLKNTKFNKIRITRACPYTGVILLRRQRHNRFASADVETKNNNIRLTF